MLLREARVVLRSESNGRREVGTSVAVEPAPGVTRGVALDIFATAAAA